VILSELTNSTEVVVKLALFFSCNPVYKILTDNNVPFQVYKKAKEEVL
jgi:hypothetical protein